MAMATAPASTMMTIQQYKAKGDFVETLLQVIAFDNVIILYFPHDFCYSKKETINKKEILFYIIHC